MTGAAERDIDTDTERIRMLPLRDARYCEHWLDGTSFIVRGPKAWDADAGKVS